LGWKNSTKNCKNFKGQDINENWNNW
jgi:hypothetical protein